MTWRERPACGICAGNAQASCLSDVLSTGLFSMLTSPLHPRHLSPQIRYPCPRSKQQTQGVPPNSFRGSNLVGI